MAKMTLDELVAQLRSAYGADLRAVVLYGSAAAGEHIPKRSDYNVLVIADNLGVDRLRNAAAVARAWAEAGNPPPLTLTSAEWRGSSDIFPMEYADILERHRALYGELPREGVHISPRDLRLQLELEAMGKLLRLRQGVLAAGGDERRLLELLERSLSAMMVLFRALVRMHGQTPATDNVALVSEAAKVGGFKAAPFERVVRHVRGEHPIAPAEAAEVLGGYLEGMERLVAHIDSFQHADR